jgi:hypothetical protein
MGGMLKTGPFLAHSRKPESSISMRETLIIDSLQPKQSNMIARERRNRMIQSLLGTLILVLSSGDLICDQTVELAFVCAIKQTKVQVTRSESG